MAEKCDEQSCSIPEQEPVDVVLYNDEKEENDEIDTTDQSKWISIILDNTVKNRTRLQVLEKYFELVSEHDTIEIINKITGIYQFSGSKILENFLYLIAVESNLSSFLKLECAKSLLSFEELEEGSDSDDDEELAQIKSESDTQIRERNLVRKQFGFKVLNDVCSNMSDMPTPCCIEAVFLLMITNDYKEQCVEYLCSLVSDEELECDYRYKILLSVEKHPEIENKEFYLYNGFFCFLLFQKNMTMYRILAGQYLLQKLKLEEVDITEIQQIILSFASDDELDYDRRADAADLLLQLGTPEMKLKGREIINHLATLKGIVRTVFDNAQNVHTVEIENSVMHILEFLADFPIFKNNGIEIDFNFINSKIDKTLEEMRDMTNSQKDSVIELLNRKQFSQFCEYCGSGVQVENLVQDKFCSQVCVDNNQKDKNIKLSLNRIYMDRLLYSKFNLTLNHILIKVYSYILAQSNWEEMYKRLLEELNDMSGTCSSGFASRLVNTISGFGEFNIQISFTDQIISNFAGRLNSRIKQITSLDSVFRNSRLRDVVNLYISEQVFLEEDSGEVRKALIADILNSETKIDECLGEFQSNVISEISVESSNYIDRKNFLLFLRSHMSSIREELYGEFKEFVSDTDFDLAIRRAIYNYEGCNY